jgi:hypothetical protein
VWVVKVHHHGPAGGRLPGLKIDLANDYVAFPEAAERQTPNGMRQRVLCLASGNLDGDGNLKTHDVQPSDGRPMSQMCDTNSNNELAENGLLSDRHQTSDAVNLSPMFSRMPQKGSLAVLLLWQREVSVEFPCALETTRLASSRTAVQLVAIRAR